MAALMCSNEDTCTHLILNADSTRICALSGRCFGQKMRDSAAGEIVAAEGAGSGVVTSVEHVFTDAVKRSQQISNRTIEDETIRTWVSSLLPEADSGLVRRLVTSIRNLWSEIVSICQRGGDMIRRRDKRCVVAAVVASLTSGLSSMTGEIVATHGRTYAAVRYNKRVMWVNTHIAISDIRAGQRILKKVFSSEKCQHVVRLNNI